MNIEKIFHTIKGELTQVNEKRKRLTLKKFAKIDTIPSPIYWEAYKIPDYSKKKYSLQELISIPSVFFIEALYLALLKRRPDEKGHSFYQQELLNGVSKAEIVARMAYSKEVRSKKIVVSGILMPGIRFAVSKIPLVSSIGSVFFTIFSLPKTLKELRGLKNQIEFKEHMLKLAIDDSINSTNVRLNQFRIACYDNFLNIDDKFKTQETEEAIGIRKNGHAIERKTATKQKKRINNSSKVSKKYKSRQ